jgi:hypothetical protein
MVIFVTLFFSQQDHSEPRPQGSGHIFNPLADARGSDSNSLFLFSAEHGLFSVKRFVIWEN